MLRECFCSRGCKTKKYSPSFAFFSNKNCLLCTLNSHPVRLQILPNLHYQILVIKSINLCLPVQFKIWAHLVEQISNSCIKHYMPESISTRFKSDSDKSQKRLVNVGDELYFFKRSSTSSSINRNILFFFLQIARFCCWLFPINR